MTLLLQFYVQARLEILKVYTSQKPIMDVNLEDIARQTDGFSGADLENLCNEVVLICTNFDCKHHLSEVHCEKYCG